MTATDLEVARQLTRVGIPLFMARPDPTHSTGYRLPMQWERRAVADTTVIDALPPAWALCAVMGHGLDLIDIDPRSGGRLPITPPTTYAWAETPSGGQHLFVASLGLPSRDSIWPGVDYKGGDAVGHGRGCAFIAPTIRRSKADGQPKPYRWRDVCLGGLTGSPDQSSEELRRHLTTLQSAPVGHQTPQTPRTIPRSVAAREWSTATTQLTDDLRRWAATGWGGEAHMGLLRYTTHLARLAPDHAEKAYRAAFAQAGLTPNSDDLSKLTSARDQAIPDIVVDDADMSAQALFWIGAVLPPQELPTSEPVDEVFGFCDPAWLNNPPEVPQATYGLFGGSQPLIYAEGVHWLQGESESGKTWVALVVALEVLRSGSTVLIVDHEDTRDGVLARLRALGIAAEELARLVYVSGHAVDHAELVAHLTSTDRDYGLLVIDGVTSALSAAGLSGRDEQEVTQWADAIPRKVRCALVVDHMVKTPDERFGMAIGSQAKKSVVTGTSFEVRCTAKFGRGTQGTLELRLQKDRRGGVRGAVGPVVRLRVVSDPLSDSLTISVVGASTASDSFLERPISAETQARIDAIVAAWQLDPRSSPSQSQTTLTKRAREMDYRADDKAMRAAYRAYVADTVPMNPTPDDD